MKPQTHDEWFKTVDSPGNRLDYLLTADAWNASHAATKESAVLIAKKYEERYMDAYKKDTSLCYTFHNVADVCNEMAGDIDTL